MKLIEIIEKAKDDIGLEPLTIMELHNIPTKDKVKVQALKSLIMAGEISDFYSFQKIAIGLSGKQVDFYNSQEPSIVDLTLALLIARSNQIKLETDVLKYIACKYVDQNLLCLPERLSDIQLFINDFLLRCGRRDIFKKVNSFNQSKTYKDDSFEHFQREKYNMLEQIIIEEEL